MDYYYIGLFGMVILSFISRNLMSSVSLKLADDKKVLLFGVFKEENRFISIISITLIGLMLLNGYFEIIDVSIGLLIFFVLELLLIVFSFFYKRKKLVNLDFPDFYIKKFVLVSLLQITGFVGLCIIILNQIVCLKY